MSATSPLPSSIREWISQSSIPPLPAAPGVALRVFVSSHCGASGVSTGTATFDPSAELPYHDHECSEAITLLEGRCRVTVEGREYELGVFDNIHVPAGVGHSVCNASAKEPMVAHWAFATADPARRFLDPPPVHSVRGMGQAEPHDPEHLTRFAGSEVYELSPGALFRDLFKGSLGSVGICGGYGRFEPGASLPCHFHNYDESITIVEGSALCLVEGNRYQVSGYDTAFVPVGKPHRFINESDREMAMIWVYAGSEPERTLIEPEYCTGAFPWPGAEAYRNSEEAQKG